MNLIFDNVALGWLAGLIAVPPLLHLFARARPPRYRFSALEFVARAARHTLRIRRPKDWLLLACRTLLLAALAALFLRPVLFRHGLPEAGGTARHLALIVDRSASMAWTEGGRSRFAAACGEAAQMLDGLSARDTANVVWLDAEPDSVFPEMGPNTAYLKSRLADVRVTRESGDPAAAVALALALLKPASGARELCIISDFQASQWKTAAPVSPPDVRVTTLSTVQDAAANGALLSLRTEPMFPLAGDPARVIAEVANYSGKPRSRTVTFEIDDRRIARTLMVPAWGTGAASIEHLFRQAGRVVVQAHLEEDAFGADDWRGCMVPVRRAIRVGLNTKDGEMGRIWSRALRALPWTETVPVSLDKPAEAAACDVLMLTGWAGEETAALARLRTEGLPMIVSPVAGLEARAIAALAGQPAAAGAVEWEILKEPVGLRVQFPDDPVFALFHDGEAGDPARATFRKRWRLSANGLAGRTLMAFTDGAPAVFRCEGTPPVVFWTAPLGADSGDWPAQLAFLPFFGELLGATRALKAGTLPVTAFPGERLNWLAGLQYDAVRLLDAQGAELPVSPGEVNLEGRRYASGPVAKPGVYRWEAGGAVRESEIVNFPPVESDLRTGDPPAGGGAGGGVARAAAEAREAREGTPLWPFLAGCCVGLAALESALVLLVDREARQRAEEQA